MRVAVAALLLVPLVLPWLGLAPDQSAPPADVEVWRFDRLDRIGGHATRVLGAPTIVESPLGAVVAFDGVEDALLVDAHPLAGAATFTWEAIFRPDGGARAQRWFHLQEDGSDNRLLFEIRVADTQWFLDAFAYSDGREKALINREALHPLGRWYHVAATYDGTTFTNYVDGVPQLAWPLRIAPQKAGRASVGVRITLVDYFTGAIHSARFTRRALQPSEFTQAPLR